MSGQWDGLKTGRSQRAIINDTGSSWRPATSGGPQCSILGQTLFNLFISDWVEGADAYSASSLSTPSWNDWPIPQRAVSFSERPWQLKQMGRKKLSEIQNWQIQGPSPGEEKPHAPAKAVGQSQAQCSEEKDLWVLVSNKLPMSQQCPCAHEDQEPETAHWGRLSSKVVDVQDIQDIQEPSGSNPVQCALGWRCWSSWATVVPSSLTHSVILWN